MWFNLALKSDDSISSFNLELGELCLLQDSVVEYKAELLRSADQGSEPMAHCNF